MYWWGRPSTLTFFLLIPIFLGAAFLSQDQWQLFDHPTNYITGMTFWIGLCGLTAYAVASLIIEVFIPQSEAEYPHVLPRYMHRAMSTLFCISVFAYMIFFYPVVIDPSIIVGLATGAISAYDLRAVLNSVPGITSFMSLQDLFVVCVVLYGRVTGEKLPRRYRRMTYLIVFLCLMRAWLWSERIAFIELVIPVIILNFAQVQDRSKTWLIFAPLLGVICLFALFSMGEYFRSWQVKQHETNLSFLQYMITRLSGYYATAINNGAAFYQHREPYYMPINTAQWFHKLPIWKIFDVQTADTSFSADDFLEVYGNPEFNNPSGLYMPYLDYGAVLGTLCWAALGIWSGWLVHSFRNRTIGGLIFYPVWFTGITEILRIFYWGNQRFFPVIVAAILLINYLKYQRSPFEADYSMSSF